MTQNRPFRPAPRHRRIYRGVTLPIGVVLLTLLTGCSSTESMQRVITQKTMEYEKHPTDYNLTDLAHTYGEMLEAQLGDTVQPGHFAEYGVALALLGKHSEANRMLNNEVMLYPNSARYVRQLKLQLVPEYLSDTVSDTSTLYIIEMVPSDSTEQGSTLVIDSAHQAKMQQQWQRERDKRQRIREKESANKERELIKSIRAKEKEQRDQERAAAKEAKEQAKAEAQKQKQEAAKQKERDKKQAAKEKEALRKEQKRMRDEAREQRARERAEARQKQTSSEQPEQE